MPPKTRSKKPTVPSINNLQPKKHSGWQGILETLHDDDVPNNSPPTEEPPAQQQSKKRSCQTVAIQGNVEDGPPAKKGKKANGAAAANNPVVDDAILTPGVTRPSRVRKPAAVISNTQDIPKRHWHTKEEVAADKVRIAAAKEAKCQAAEELIQKAEEAKAFLAQMNIDEEQADARTENENPCRLSAVKRKCGGAQVEESEGESFDEVPEDTESEIEIFVSIPEINTFVH